MPQTANPARRIAVRHGPLQIFVNGLLLFMALAGTVFTAVEAYAIVVQPVTLLLLCLGCTLIFLTAYPYPSIAGRFCLSWPLLWALLSGGYGPF